MVDNHNEQNELPPNYDQLKTSANRSANWRERLDAVEQLGQWKNKQTIDVLRHRMTSDPVYKIQEAAFRKLKDLGEEVELPPRRKGELIKGAAKALVNLKKSLPKGHSFEDFKDKLQRTRADLYDTYEGDKGADFENWLKNTWEALSNKANSKL